jgi:hypothetical protein
MMPVTTEKRKEKEKQTTSRSWSSLARLRSVHWTVWLLLAVIVFFATVRFRLREMPLERDEGEYAYAGQLMLQGIPPYQLAYNMKLPGTYAAYAIILAVFGQTSAGIHTGLLLMNAATTLLVFVLGRKLFGTIPGAFCGMTYAMLSTSRTVLGLAGHATHFVVLAAVAGILLLIYALESDRVALYFWSGTCLGLAFLMKQQGIVFAMFAVAYPVYRKWEHRMDWCYAASRAGALLAGMAWPFGLTCLALYWAGVFSQFWFWTFTYARTYEIIHPFVMGMEAFGATAGLMLRLDWAIWVVVLCGLVALFWNRRSNDHYGLVGGLLAFSSLGVSAGLYFRGHYFVMLAPVAALCAGFAVDHSIRFLQARQLGAAAVAIPAAVFAVALIISIANERTFFFAPDPVTASQRMYLGNAFPEAEEIAEYLKANTPPTARLAIFGSEPEIYFSSQRRSVTGYIYTYALMEDQKYATQMQQEMIKEVVRARPEYVVFVDDGMSWLWQPGPSREAFFQWIRMFLTTDYEKVAQVDIAGSPPHLVEDASRIYVFQRRTH